MASRWLPSRPRRDLILAVIEEQPGLSFRALCRATGIKPGTLHYHLTALLRMGSIWTTRHGTCLRHFPGRAPLSPAEIREALAEHALDAIDRTLLAWVRDAGPASQKAALDAHAATGVPRTSLQRRLNRLAEQGFLDSEKGVHSVLYSAA